MIIGGNVWRSQTLKPLTDSFERADPSEYSFAFPAKFGDFSTLLSDFFSEKRLSTNIVTFSAVTGEFSDVLETLT